MARLLFQYLANYSLKIYPIALGICQSVFEILPNTFGHFNICQSRFNFCPSGEILPNLVTLIEKPPLTTSPPSFAGLGSRKCDQMVCSILAIHSDEHFPNIFKRIAKVDSKFRQPLHYLFLPK